MHLVICLSLIAFVSADGFSQARWEQQHWFHDCPGWYAQNAIFTMREKLCELCQIVLGGTSQPTLRQDCARNCFDNEVYYKCEDAAAKQVTAQYCKYAGDVEDCRRRLLIVNPYDHW